LDIKNKIRHLVISSILLPLILIIPCLLYAFGGPGAPGYAGSNKCGECHEEVYEMWKKTPHANMLRNAKENPDVIEARNFDVVPFEKDDIYWTIGSHWIQKYITFIDDDYYVLPKYWNIAKGEWEPYSIFNWRQQPYTVFCDGCHTTGFDPESKTFAEASIGCEACHGPGKKHAETEEPESIVNPAKLDKVRRDMVCEACHTDGKDKKFGGVYPFPAGYSAGEDLNEYFTEFFAPKPKSRAWYWGTVDYRERHRMYLFWANKFYSTARACDVCGFDRGITQVQERYMSRDEYCGTCHGRIYKIESLHTRHSPEDVQCIDCHTPKTTGDGQRYSIHDHKFDFSGPPLACTECHDKDDERLKKKPRHTFHFTPVRDREVSSVKDACKRCHNGMNVIEAYDKWNDKRILK
jgi:formate-dependent nitrite reductase cytochrome c552 subunit